MKYLMLLTNDADEIARWEALSDEEKQALRAEEMPQWNELFAYMQQKGAWGDGLELDEPHTARTVRIRDGEALVTDGPYAETKEQIGGFFDTNLPDLDTALEYAARIPASEYGSVEVRPVVERP